MREPYYFVASNREKKIEYFNLKKKKKKVEIHIRHFQQVEDDLVFSGTIYALASRFG